MRDKKTQPKLLIVAIALIALVALTAFVWRQQGDDKPSSQQSASSISQTEETSQAASDTVSYDGEEGKNALELLKAKADVVTKQSAYGEYVDSVNGVQGGEDGKYWAFYVNGEMAQVGAADYQTKEGDKIEWKFE